MSKILISYKQKETRFFGDSWEFPFELELECTYFFGLLKKIEKVQYVVSMFQDIRQHKDHWDNLIKTKSKIK